MRFRWLGLLVCCLAAAGCVGVLDDPSGAEGATPTPAAFPAASESANRTATSVTSWPDGSALVDLRFSAPDASTVTLVGEIQASWTGAEAYEAPDPPVSESNLSEQPEVETLVFAVWEETEDAPKIVEVQAYSCLLPTSSTLYLEAGTPLGSVEIERFVGNSTGRGGGCALTLGQEGLELPTGDGQRYRVMAFASNATGRLNGTWIDYTVETPQPERVEAHHGGEYLLREDTLFDSQARASTEAWRVHEARTGASGTLTATTQATTFLRFVPAHGLGAQATYEYDGPDHEPIQGQQVGDRLFSPSSATAGANYRPATAVGPPGEWQATTHQLTCQSSESRCEGLFLLVDLTNRTSLPLG